MSGRAKRIVLSDSSSIGSPRNNSGQKVKKLVLLGCGGFIGSHLLDALLPVKSLRIEGWDPHDRKITCHLANPNLRLYRKALRDTTIYDDLDKAIRDADVVINLAAICSPSQYNTKPLDVIYANLFDVYKIVEICSDYGKWLIHFSTSEVYGRTISSYVPNNSYDDPDLYELDEDTAPLIMGPVKNQRWTYACAKQVLERLIFAHHEQRRLPFTIIRPFNFFGPRMDFIPGRDGEGVPRVLACFMTALLDGKPMRLVDGGMARRTVVSIHDAVSAVMLMLEKPEKAMNQIFNIGNRDNEVTMAELADLMRRTYAKITGNQAFNDHPIELVTAKEFYGDGYEDCDRRMPNLDKARVLLGWTPRISLQDTITEAMTYYYNNYGKDSAETKYKRESFAPSS